jgi:murein DD-endopeptidase MepM/ murein hydrolase activator NlpD
LLPFARRSGVSGIVTGSLIDSTSIVGVPTAAMLEPLQALATVLDPERDLRNGDRFYIRYEAEFTGAGRATGTARVLWLELQTKAKGTIALHRFRSRDGTELFHLANGKAAAPATLRPPLATVTISSGFGLRADPLDHPTTSAPVIEVVKPETPQVQQDAAPAPEPREVAQARAGFASGNGSQVGSARDAFVSGGGTDVDRVMAQRRVRAREEEARKLEEEKAAAAKAAEPVVALAPAPPPQPRKLFMHIGTDMVANSGTPVYAAADGIVVGAGPNGGYGNWVRITHGPKLTSVYGHLSGFAPGLEPGTLVSRGELIGFVGSTGRSTGAHLHYEVLVDGRPVNPMDNPAVRVRQLAGPELERFKKQVAASLRERERENIQ